MFPIRVTTDEVLALLSKVAAHPPEVGQRLQWFLHFAESRSVRGTCRHFGIARTTFYRWARRFDATDLSTLADRPTWPADVHHAAGGTFAGLPQGARPVPQPAGAPDRRSVLARHAKRAFLATSLIINVALLASLLITALWESRRATDAVPVPAQLSGSAIPAFDPIP